MKFSVWDYSQIKIAQFNTSHPALEIKLQGRKLRMQHRMEMEV